MRSIARWVLPVLVGPSTATRRGAERYRLMPEGCGQAAGRASANSRGIASPPGGGSEPRHRRLARQAGLGGEADRRVGRAVAAIAAAALDDLEKEPAGLGAGIGVEELAAVLPVVKDAGGLQTLDQRGVEIAAGGEVGVVVFRDRQQGDAVRGQPGDGGEDVARGERDLLHPGAEEIVDETRRQGLPALRGVEHEAERAVGAFDRLAL